MLIPSFTLPRHTALVSLTLALAAAPALAETIMKPGLYEMSTKQTGNNQMAAAMAAAQKAMAEMPPAQRKAMEDMMAKHGNGARMTTSADGGIAIRMCVTKEMVAQSELPTQASGKCTQTKGPLVGGVMKFSFTCTDPESSGDGEFRVINANSFSSSMDIRSKMKGAETMHIESTSKWLGADCGNVKPVAMPPSNPVPAKKG
jgi:hypothetical protein